MSRSVRNRKTFRDLFRIPVPEKKSERPYPDTDPAQTDRFAIRDYTGKEPEANEDQTTGKTIPV